MSFLWQMLRQTRVPAVLGLTLLAAVAVTLVLVSRDPPVPEDREAVVFWHFWGGEDRKVVQAIVDRFNAGQDKYFVRAIAMPGNNLDLKVFLAVTGGDPPDLINQDDPIIADWAHRQALMPIDQLASNQTLEQLRAWMLPTAWRLGEYQDRLFAVCNGLDIRALYYDRTLIEQAGLELPQTLPELDRVAAELTVRNEAGRYQRFGYLPDSRRLWVWGAVFGGDFYDKQRQEVTANDRRIVEALDWMASYRRRYGADTIASFRQGDQSLPGSIFPLLPIGDRNQHGRYAFLLDGQWRVREINRFVEDRRERGLPHPEYGVMPLPPPPGGRTRAGWLNGNFFIVPRGAPHAEGAWEFIQFWIGFESEQDGEPHTLPNRSEPDQEGDVGETAESRAAEYFIRGGWIPVSRHIISTPNYQQYLDQQPLFRTFVDLASSPHQFPIPLIPGAAYYDREVKKAGAEALYSPDAPSSQKLLDDVQHRVQQHLHRILQSRRTPSTHRTSEHTSEHTSERELRTGGAP